MKIYETNMTEKEVEKIGKAYSKEISSAFFYFIFSAIILVLFNMYYTEQGFYRLIFNAPIFLFGLFQLKKAIKLLFFDTIKKDFEQKKKIKITLIVSKKNEEHESFDGPNSSANIEFKKNPYFRSLDISESSYLSISIGDKVNFELSKYGKWLIKVNSNSRNIDYNTYNVVRANRIKRLKTNAK